MIKLNDNGESLELKDLSFKKIYNYIRSKFRKWFGGIRIQEEDVITFSEIILFRATNCAECVADKACLKSKGGCGCPVPQLFSAMNAECGRSGDDKKWYSLSEDNWVKEWNDYKSKNKLFFTIFYG